jgi:hypothetical protein
MVSDESKLQEEYKKLFYTAAQAEILERIKLRDQQVLAYVTAISIIGGISVNSKNIDILLIIPFISLVTTAIYCQHYMLIGQISSYIFTLFKNLKSTENETSKQRLLHWDQFHAIDKYNPLDFSSFPQLISLSKILPATVLFLFPSIAILILPWLLKGISWKVVDIGTVRWIIGIVTLIISLLLVGSYYDRRERLKVYIDPIEK